MVDCGVVILIASGVGRRGRRIGSDGSRTRQMLHPQSTTGLFELVAGRVLRLVRRMADRPFVAPTVAGQCRIRTDFPRWATCGGDPSRAPILPAPPGLAISCSDWAGSVRGRGQEP